MNVYYSTPVLESLTSKGLKKFWQGHAAMIDENQAGYFSEAWQLKTNGSPSSKLVSTISIRSGKNLGKTNETSSREQARLEIISKCNRKISAGYVDPNTVINARLPLPMLAHTYEKRGHDIDWDGGVFVQPKLDGTRMLFDGNRGWSRQGKLYIPEVIAHLTCKLPPGVILDGELMLRPGYGTFQDSMKAIKKYRPGISEKLIYNVYDILTTKGTFGQRTKALAHIYWSDKWNLHENSQYYLVQTVKIFGERDITKWHSTWVKGGHEGIIIRNAQGVYKIGHRSADLQKLKHFLDDEFEIVGFLEGSGKEAGCAIFQCKTKEGKVFKVRPRGTISERRNFFQIGEELIGIPLTVRFQELTDSGIPRFPVGIAIRDYEDNIIIKQ